MSDEKTTGRKALAGITKQYLDDLLELNSKTTAQMQRGISEGYLDRDGAIDLARKLRVEEPRVRRDYRFYFEVTEPYVITASGYSEEEALLEAQHHFAENDRYGEVHYGSRTRFRDVRPGGTGPRRRFSELATQRPMVHQPLPVAPRTVERGEQIERDRAVRERSVDASPLASID